MEAGKYEVTVRGTRFAVRLLDESKIRVVVSEGSVDVSMQDGKTESVGTNESLVFSDSAPTRREPETIARRVDLLLEGRLPDPVEDVNPPTQSSVKRPTASASPSADGVGQWRRWVIEGQIPEAIEALSKHLKKSPMDYDAWWLLGDCYRKTRKWKEALASYEEVIQMAPEAIANRARFRAGVILQDRLGDPASAAKHFAKYLKRGQGATLAPEVMLRLAMTHQTLGNQAEAVRLLEELKTKFGGTEAAKRADERLSPITQ